MSGQQARLTFGYGLSEDVTVGFLVGFGEVVNKVKVAVTGSNFAATGNPALRLRPGVGLVRPGRQPGLRRGLEAVLP